MVGWGKIWFAAFDGRPRKPLIDAKNLADIFYGSRVITRFVPNFVAMATGVGEEKMWIAAIDGPTAETHL